MDSLNLTGSANLHLKIGSFGGLFALLVASFPPAQAYVLAMVAALFLSKM
ncbi:hypothetical protein ABRZ58_22700 [Vibrio vulnificus]|nr:MULTISPECIES: hypothetical protein [Vibrio]ELJ8616587.1 hypothetical protein [Vibrio cholerae]HAS6222139.1 hypothetical protein [Vibrio vulnificus]EHH2421779.1 hypothetical protein [Vibrio parahaemolyticus]EKA7384284.1 hypothetical protein [Vibrio parahaemolyticus]ELA7420878.1 hypothetical protein [Vibrio parahaemolyticus]